MESKSSRQNRDIILIIDDDVINREIMKNIFASEYGIMEAENGLDGLNIITEHVHRLCSILLDANMPVMNGIELLNELKKRNILSKVPVFLITANNEIALAQEAFNLGVMDVILKPVTPFIILRRVQSVIELFRAREVLSNTVRGQKKQLQENASTIELLHRNTIEALASAIEFRDVESGEHTNRIYGITKLLLSSTEMGNGFSAEDIENMSIGSIMHDIGKIAISDIILNKPGRLTPEEFELIKQHTVKGGVLMEQISDKQNHDAYHYACDIARHHHERWDGSGYPDHLKGDEITVWSQVVSIADVYDALVSPRVYKKAFSHEKAVEMIFNGQCGVFNPKLLKCFLQVESELKLLYSDSAESMADDTQPDQASVGIPHKPINHVKFADEINQPSRELTSILLLTEAVKSATDMIICCNLTQNRYYMISYDRFLTHKATSNGVFDELIDHGAASIPESHRRQFIDTFSRESLLNAFSNGEKSIHLIHPQYTDSGELKKVATSVLFVEDPRNGDVCEITLSQYLTEEDEKTDGKSHDKKRKGLFSWNLKN